MRTRNHSLKRGAVEGRECNWEAIVYYSSRTAFYLHPLLVDAGRRMVREPDEKKKRK